MFPEKPQNPYDQIIEELFKQSEEDCSNQRRFSLMPISDSYYLSQKLYPKSRISIFQEIDVLKNIKIVSLAHQNNKKSKDHPAILEQDRRREESSSKKTSKIATKPKMLELQRSNPQRQIQNLKLNLKNAREQNQTYLQGRSKAIKQKIRFKISERTDTKPLYFVPANQRELISQTCGNVSNIVQRYDCNLQQKMIRRSISTRRCQPLEVALSRPQDPKVQDKDSDSSVIPLKVDDDSSAIPSKIDKEDPSLTKLQKDHRRCRKMFKELISRKGKQQNFKDIYVNQISLLKPIRINKNLTKKSNQDKSLAQSCKTVSQSKRGPSKTERSPTDSKKSDKSLKKDSKMMKKLEILKNRYHNFIGETTHINNQVRVIGNHDQLHRNLTEGADVSKPMPFSPLDVQKIQSDSRDISIVNINNAVTSKKVIFSKKHTLRSPERVPKAFALEEPKIRF